ncbi:hypothetical protein C8Q80DRAFT_404561 [Daedaleopsis nitida]|nr:hypothetical protein C8Q80DRAFT_404561 [Daedaleopsis nitida]
MATYYVQPRPPTASGNSATRSEGVGESSRYPNPLTSQDDISPDRSLYIFPSPSSDPPTPSPISPGSSLVSAPTEYDFSESSSLGLRSRTSSYSPSGAASPPESGVAVLQRRVSSLPDGEMEIDVELWELSTDPEQGMDAPDSDSSWVLEDEVERVSAGGIDLSYLTSTRQPRRTHRLSSPTTTDAIPSQHYWAMRSHRRTRTHSRIRTISSLSSTGASSTTRRPSPNPRIHVPLLSFFSSLLSIDLDDPAIRLLTHADPGEAQSVLFPGHTTSQLLAGHAGAALDYRRGRDVDSDSDSVHSEDEPHGMPKLLLASISDQSTVALRSLRAGLAVCMPQSAGVGLSIPNPAELWQVVGEVCVRGSQAWREVWRSGRSDS